ncbi:MAG: Tetratricopeptide 1 repeat-containing protein [Acidobacteria bacterium]|nr:Tetratricopeptide 1 repeat-containing protein [Acidobacteriota bacterium]
MGPTTCLRTLCVPLLVALTFGGPAAAPSPSPSEVYRQARAAVDEGEIAKAQKQVEAALARVGTRDDDDVWALRILYAEILLNKRRNSEAANILRPPLPRRLCQSETAFWHFYNLGVYYSRKGNDANALREMSLACRLARTKHRRLLPLAMAAHGQFSLNIDETREAFQLAQRAGSLLMMKKVAGTLGKAEAGAGRFDRAIVVWQALIDGLPAGYRGNIIEKTKGNLGWAYTELGNYEQATKLFLSANEGAEKLGEEGDRVPWLDQLGFLRYLQRDWSGATVYFQQAYQLANRLGHPDQGDALSLLARVKVETGQLDEAARLALLARDLKKKGKNPNDDFDSTILEARIAIARGEYSLGETKLRQVIARTKVPPSILWEARGALAELYAKSGRSERAAEQYALAMRTVQETRRALAKEDFSQVRTIGLSLSFYNLVEDLFGSYVGLLIDSGKIEEALAVTEQSRAQALEEGENQEAAKGPIDPRIASRNAGAPILCYWLARERSFLWVITSTSVRAVVLPGQKELEEKIDGFQQALRSLRDPLESAQTSGQELYGILVKKAGLRIKPGGRVVVIPAGRLSAYNMETLIVPGGAPHFWLEDVVLTTASSLSRVARPRRLSPAPNASILIVGDPDEVDPRFPALEKAGEEMSNVARHFRTARKLEGADANPRQYRQSSPGSFAFIHFVAHGVPGGALPLESAVILSRSKEGDRSYKLYARDVIDTPLQARLVTISSCHGAGTSTFIGEGLVGLAWAFLQAGSHQVIAALWEVNDYATPELMDNLYDGISRGQDAATALRAAKLKMLHNRSSITRLPRYWAPFVLYEGS